MKAHVWSTAVLAVLLGAAAVSPATAGENDPPPQTQLNARPTLSEKKVRLIGGSDNVVRSGPGDTFAIVGVYSEGAEFPVIAKRGEWYNVRLSDINTGWVHASLCKELDDMSDLEFRPNPRLFSRIGSFTLTAYTGGYAFDEKSNSLVLGGRVGYYVFEFLEIEGSVGWTHIVRPAEIVESLFDLALEEEDFEMVFYAMNANVILLPGRQLVPFVTGGVGSSISRGDTENSWNFGIGADVFVKKTVAVRFEFRNYRFDYGTAESRTQASNFEFGVGATLFL
jgi:opacity protein-like surface antigen